MIRRKSIRSSKKAEDDNSGDIDGVDSANSSDPCSSQSVTTASCSAPSSCLSTDLKGRSDSVQSPPIHDGFIHDGSAHTMLSTEFMGDTLEQLSNLGVESFQASNLENMLAKEIDYKLEQRAAYAESHALSRLKLKRKRCMTEISRLSRAFGHLLSLHKPSEVELLGELASQLDRQKKQLSDIDTEMAELIKELDLEAKKRCGQSEVDSENRGVHLNLDFGLRASTLEQAQQFKKRKKKDDEYLIELSSEDEVFQVNDDLLDEEAAADRDVQSPSAPPASAVRRKRIQDDDDIDDYSDEHYVSRLRAWFVESQRELELRQKKEVSESSNPARSDDLDHLLADDHLVQLDVGLSIESRQYRQLFEHQRVALKWLWDLHQQKAGGILGDDMGLGKTIEVIAFLQALVTSGYLTKPILVVFPATVMKHWMREFHLWAPVFRVIVFQLSPVLGKRTPEELIKYCSHLVHRRSVFDQIKLETLGPEFSAFGDDSALSEMELRIRKRIQNHTPVALLCSYEALRMHSRSFSQISWLYAIMDEGQRLRNPDAMTTLASKQLLTDHRLILTGCPIQNSLRELWSLFDFCFPGKLGTLDLFESQFSNPIQRGGYANATPTEVRTAYRSAVVLRDMVNPYLLRRSKDQVNIRLPKKNEQILFCRLTDIQKVRYRRFLCSKEAELVYKGKMNMLYGIDILRKICNHVWLTEPDHGASKAASVRCIDDLVSGSAKLKMLHHILELWKKENRRVLIFAQTIQMLNIIETLISLNNYIYARMDGQLPVAKRQHLVDRFNAEGSDIYVFLLTTRVGGLGINLVSANRVIIFDPDWNPMTDLQARERTYRIGQRNDVTVYRFVMSGSIEEKIYHRQIFKQFLTQKILGDPKKTKSFFSDSDLRELFHLDERDDSGSQCLFHVTTQAEKEVFHGKAEDLLLKALIGKGMTSKLDHDLLLDGVTGERPSGGLTHSVPDLMNQEAEELAKAAVSRLIESQKLSSAFGDSSSQKKRPMFGRSSSFSGASSSTTPLTSDRASAPGQPLTGKALIESMRNFVSDDRVAHTDHVLKMLRRFLSCQANGEASSEAIIGYFKSTVSKNDMLLFRQLLRLVADFRPEGKRWILKPWAGVDVDRETE